MSWTKVINYLSGDIAGDVVWQGPQIKSVRDGFHQWRIKQTEPGEDRFISLYFQPSFGFGNSGNPFTYMYIEMDLAAARRSLDSLSEIIDLMENKGQ